MAEVRFMRRALALARRGRGHTSPNPMVGAVLLKGGRVVAEGYHRRPGAPHAEAVALQRAGPRARGATLYVNLEPCVHTHKRTPPCTEAIIRAGVKRVVAAMKDPNPRVNGKGFEALTKAGIEVEVGLLEAEALRLNEAYVKHIQTGMPFVMLKVAMTLDGKIATSTGQSKWITGPQARRMVHALRARVDAVLTAVGTVLADDPALTVRFLKRPPRQPLRVVIDPELQSPLGAQVFRTPPPTLLVSRRPLPEALRRQGVEGLMFSTRELSLRWLLRELGKRGITSVLIEGGSALAGRAVAERVPDKVVFFIAPKLLGGKQSYPAVGGPEPRSLQDALPLGQMKVRRVGEDLLVEAYVEPSGQGRFSSSTFMMRGLGGACLRVDSSTQV
jgi:diaminohydroxyphosphoribosylaminopyrimidine deaminase/5-amino-6-(5-phosphoribosylamino)uracil reductase